VILFMQLDCFSKVTMDDFALMPNCFSKVTMDDFALMPNSQCHE